jgi:endonuclease/exonuclease/phosphatase family metal-dependent hydrolase
MRAHGKPKFQYSFEVSKEIKAIDSHKKLRNIPAKSANKLLIATWNLTNFGVQERKEQHIALMAHIIKMFDVIAIQEIAEDLRQFDQLLEAIGGNYKAIFSDTGGNAERGAFIYDSKKVTQQGLVAELVMKTNRDNRITVTVGDEQETAVFTDYNRNPYMANFACKGFDFTLVNVHLYWSNEFIRTQEVLALSKWAKKRSALKEYQRPSKDIMLVGDFNMPSFDADDPIYAPIKANGLYAPLHDTEYVGSNLAGDKSYDQLFFFPKHSADSFNEGQVGVFDFDNALFQDLYESVKDDKTKKKRFFEYIRYYIADHRPLWVEFGV